MTPNATLQKFLMCSYEYYIRLNSLVEDHEYDTMAKTLLNSWDEWQDHQHAHLVTKGDLQAGTMFTLKDSDYPMIIKQGADIWSRETCNDH